MMIPNSAKAAARQLLAVTGACVTGAALYRYSSVKRRELLLPKEPLEVFLSATDSKKPVIIIGGGVVGVTTAYKLGLAGHAVILLDSASKSAAECSACAAGGMQRSNLVVDRNAWIAVIQCVAPDTITRLLFGNGEKEDFKFFHQAWGPTLSDPFFVLRWLPTFTLTSLFPNSKQQEKQDEMLKFTDFAVKAMTEMMENRRDNMGKVSGYNTRGCVSVSYSPPAVDDNAKATAPTDSSSHSKNTYEPARPLTGEELLREEPSLRWQENQPTSAKYQWDAKSASSQRFTRELAKRCTDDPKLNVSILYNTKVEAITVKESSSSSDGSKNKPRISQLKTNRGCIEVSDDVQVVVAAGSWTPHIMALMDLYTPVYPLKGYAISVSASEALAAKQPPILKPQDLPSRIVCDKYMYTSRLGDEIRITSIGEFSGWNTAPTLAVDKDFRREAARQFPQLQALIAAAPTHCGLRPFVNDGILLLGAVDTHDNLFVSCGPGSNGWKLAMGSGEVIQRLISGQTPGQIEEELGFDVGAFSPAGRVRNAPFFAKLCRARWNV